MSRKNLLTGLLGDELPAGNSPAQAHPEAEKAAAPHLGVMGTRGAIGAVTRSIEQLKAHSIVDLDPELIDPSFIADRMESTLESHKALVDSIREHGQQVPALVRPHPHKEGRYQIAYGRRRLRAVAELGRPLRAVVKPLTDQQLVVAQGPISRSSRGRSLQPGWRRAVMTAKRSWPRYRSTRQGCRG
jgi:ParB family chromosome partitioning protein